jgi:hypothetical protein
MVFGFGSLKYMRVMNSYYNSHSPASSIDWGMSVSAIWGKPMD